MIVYCSNNTMKPYFITYDTKDLCIWGSHQSDPKLSMDDAEYNLGVAKDPRKNISYTIEKFVTIPATMELWRNLEGNGWQDQKWEIVNGVADLKKRKAKL